MLLLLLCWVALPEESLGISSPCPGVPVGPGGHPEVKPGDHLRLEEMEGWR